MTPSQASLYRVFVAARHSAHLAARPALREQWLEAVDALGSFLDLVPTSQGGGRGGAGLIGGRARPGARRLCGAALGAAWRGAGVQGHGTEAWRSR
jgi:hypothetical protein